jgi:hypothetical protein
MSNFGKIENGVVVKSIVARQAYIDRQANPNEWVRLPPGVGVGCLSRGDEFTDAQGEAVQASSEVKAGDYVLTGAEWVGRFTDVEWSWLKAQRQMLTPAGKKLDRLMDAIQWTDSINVQPGSASDAFYGWLTNNIPGGQGRVDELRAPK